MQFDVLLCFSAPDADYADWLVGKLTARGRSALCIDRSADSGTTRDATDRAGCVLQVWSAEAEREDAERLSPDPRSVWLLRGQCDRPFGVAHQPAVAAPEASDVEMTIPALLRAIEHAQNVFYKSPDTPDVFISYSKRDAAYVEWFANALMQRGFSVWWDRDLDVGSSWHANTLAFLKRAHCAIVIWSRHSVASEFVRDEADRAKPKLVPLRLDDCELPIGHGAFQCHNAPIIGGEDESAIDPIAEAIGRFCRQKRKLPEKPRVFVVEDNVSLLEQLTESLVASGYAVSAFGDGEAPLARLSTETPNLIITELSLPKRDGITMLKEFRRRPKTRQTPIIVLSARDRWSEKVEGLDLGAQDYITKPFNMGELLARVRSVLNTKRTAVTRDAVDVGLLRLDPNANRAYFGEQRLALSALEFDLVHTLASQPNFAIGFAELFPGEGPEVLEKLRAACATINAELRHLGAERDILFALDDHFVLLDRD